MQTKQKLLDRLGILTDEVSPYLIEALDWITANELRHVELRSVQGMNILNFSSAEITDMLKEIELRGLFVSALASPVFKCPLSPDRTTMQGDQFGQLEHHDVAGHFRLLHRALDAAELLRTRYIRIFSFWREDDPGAYAEEIAGHLYAAAEIAHSRGAVLLLENEPSCNGGSAEETGRLAALADHPALKLLWDPGNEAFLGRPAYPDGYNSVKPYIAHVHLKDSIYHPDAGGQCVPIGRGSVDYAQQLAALMKEGYTGLFTIETHYRPLNGSTADGSAMSLNGLRQLLPQ